MARKIINNKIILDNEYFLKVASAIQGYIKDTTDYRKSIDFRKQLESKDYNIINKLIGKDFNPSEIDHNNIIKQFAKKNNANYDEKELKRLQRYYNKYQEIFYTRAENGSLVRETNKEKILNNDVFKNIDEKLKKAEENLRKNYDLDPEDYDVILNGKDNVDSYLDTYQSQFEYEEELELNKNKKNAETHKETSNNNNSNNNTTSDNSTTTTTTGGENDTTSKAESNIPELEEPPVSNGDTTSDTHSEEQHENKSEGKKETKAPENNPDGTPKTKQERKRERKREKKKQRREKNKKNRQERRKKEKQKKQEERERREKAEREADRNSTTTNGNEEELKRTAEKEAKKNIENEVEKEVKDEAEKTVKNAAEETIEGTAKAVGKEGEEKLEQSAIKTLLKKNGVGGIISGIMAVSDYKDARNDGHGVIASAAKAGAMYALGNAALPITIAKQIPSLIVSGIDTLQKTSRSMNNASRFQTFGNAEFHDTKQLATMRQSGMELAKMSQYNMQQAIMGNEAQYMHRV